MQARFIAIKSALLEDIRYARLVPGQKIPSENQLATSFDVSRMTARRAITELVDEGILMRAQGLGTFVADERPMSSMLTIRSIDEEVRHRGHQYHNRVLALDNQSASLEQANWLALPADSDVFFLHVIHFEDDAPIQLERRWINPSLAPDFLAQDFTRQTANQYLSKVAPLTEADHIVEAILPDEQSAQQLNMTSTQPCLQVSRRTYSERGIVSFAVLMHPGDRYRLGGHLAF